MRIQSVQMLRAVAALLVVFGHALGIGAAMGGVPRPPIPTGVGVDLFFAISGFIMVYASDGLFTRPGAARVFLVKRIERVAPLYWLATSLMLAMLLARSQNGAALPSLGYVVSSYLFIPDASFGSVDGVPFPLLSLGWTLNYEMLFYLVFSAFLFLPRYIAVAGVQVALIAAVLAGGLLEPRSLLLATWTQPIVLEFALGLLIGNAFLDGVRLSRGTALVLLAVAAVWTLLDPCELLTAHQTPSDARRLLGWGVPAAMVLAATLLGPGALARWAERPAAVLGDASYSLYLTHTFALIVLERAWLRLIGSDHLALFVIAALLLSTVLAVAVNKAIEQPIALALKRLRRPSRQVTPLQPSG